jgi:hypothetical protein
MRRVWMCLPLMGMSLVCAGCRSTCGGNPPPPKTVVVAPPPAPVVGQPPASFGPPGPAFPTAQPPASFGPPGSVQQPPPGAQLVPPIQPAPSIKPMPGQGGSSANRIETDWQAVEGREPERNKPSIQLYAPEEIAKEKPDATPEPPLAKKPTVQGSFPGIAQFAVVKDNIYTGLRPPLDGLDWLQQNGVHTVVHVHSANTDDSADRLQVEKRKMQYVSFAVSPQTLTKEKADEFIKLIRDNAKQGIFVYDADGSLAGSLWYLNFRWGEFLDDDAAQLRAAQHGLRPNAPGQERDMWLAVQKVLSENSR